jgi:hypothetical protein
LVHTLQMGEEAGNMLGGNADALHVPTFAPQTVTQFVTDLCLNEIEDRGALQIEDGVVLVPYYSNHHLETVLTRPKR